jgi:hypothetical protein
MSKQKQKKTIPFVKYYLELTYLFSAAEIQFIMHMVDIKFLKEAGYQTGWSKAEHMKRMGLNEYTFDKCVKRLQEMRLLSRTYNKLGNRVFYSFNMELYRRLVEILSVTCDIDRLIEFCDRNFKKQSRPIESITEEEIRELGTHEWEKNLPSSMLYFRKKENI